jgi:putative transposase
MRQQGLLCRSRRRWIATTDSKHGLRVYPNLMLGLVVENLNRLWVLDLTCIRLP